MPSSMTATETMSYCTMTSTGTMTAIDEAKTNPTQRERPTLMPAVRAMSMSTLTATTRKNTIIALAHSWAGTDDR